MGNPRKTESQKESRLTWALTGWQWGDSCVIENFRGNRSRGSGVGKEERGRCGLCTFRLSKPFQTVPRCFYLWSFYFKHFFFISLDVVQTKAIPTWPWSPPPVHTHLFSGWKCHPSSIHPFFSLNFRWSQKHGSYEKKFFGEITSSPLVANLTFSCPEIELWIHLNLDSFPDPRGQISPPLVRIFPFGCNYIWKLC